MNSERAEQSPADEIVTSLTVVDLNGVDRDLLILERTNDTPSGSVRVDLDEFDEVYVPLSVLDDSATPEERFAFTALFEPAMVEARAAERRRRVLNGSQALQERRLCVVTIAGDTKPAGLLSVTRAARRRAAWRVIDGGRE